jgi:L-lactate dehydrogenase complex protein LldF
MLNPIRVAVHRALAARERLLQGYPGWEEWRGQAQAIKAEAISRLDELLGCLKNEVEKWGGLVLFARDAGHARDLIIEVARRHRVTAVVKSKSMTTEEISLNPALTAAGIQTLETDLGEFIVQLAGQPPAHLTAPALHLNRRQIARLFQENLGQSFQEEPEALTQRATEYLKPYYYQAQMGITGVNFAAADGTLVLLENEGNLRLTASLPGVHLALMGLEKVIPALKDAEVFLRLLPASATGQRATALVHFIRGLKPHGKGSQAFYLIILDNGRRRLAAAPELKEALYCLRCGACLNICPIFQEGAAHLYGRVYPGAIGILLAPFLAPVGDISDLCTQCGACTEICPVKIPLAEKIIEVRRLSPKFKRLRLLSRLAGLGLARPFLYRHLEPGLRLLQNHLPGLISRSSSALILSPESFHRRRQWYRGGGQGSQTPLQSSPISSPPTPYAGWEGGGGRGQGPVAQASSLWEPPGPPPTLEARLTEAAASLHEVRGPEALARLLAVAKEPLWLEDHPWLRQAAPELEKLGVKPRFADAPEAPPAHTAVTVALGAIPETGSVLVSAVGAAAGLLPLKARRHIVLVPPERAGLSLSQALELTRQGGALVTWLTGPTRTADIEKVLVLGAQGPGELDLVLYQPEA